MTSASVVSEPVRDALADRYVVERELGAGGMATVYLAQDVRHDRPVALKVFRPEVGAAFGAERFVREIKMLARLRHPFILPLLDSGEAAGTLYFVMPYIDGGSLRGRLVREGPLPIEEAPIRKMGKKLVAARELDEGHVLTAEDVAIKSPADGGLPPYELDRIVGSRLRRRLAPDENVELADLEPVEEPVAAHAAPRR
jgi:hypothetical protein